MASLRAVEPDTVERPGPQRAASPVRLIVQWVIGIVAAFALGTWLVWWAAQVQRHAAIEDVRGACQRVMPETIERCIDTVILQRGGARR